MSEWPRHYYEFGSFRLDPDEGVLMRDGELVSLPPKVFETLKVLVEGSGRVLKKEDLMARIWPDSFVEESNLAQNISMLRRALGEGKDGQKFIETLSKRGYRFVAPVREITPDSQPEAVPVPVHSPAFNDSATDQTTVENGADQDQADEGEMSGDAPEMVTMQATDQTLMPEQAKPQTAAVSLSQKILLTKAALLAAAFIIVAALAVAAYLAFSKKISHSKQRTLAVLPFRNIKPDPETDFLGFSLADAVITKLGYVGEMTVRPSSYVEKYRHQEVDPDRVAEDLRVNTLLTGTFLHEGDELKLNVQLFDVTDHAQLWAEAITLKYDKLPTVQDQVAQRIIEALQLNLQPAEAQRLQRDAPHNAQAYEFFLRGVDLYWSNEFKSAFRMLEQSVTIDPNYAQAWAHLGRAYTAGGSIDFGGQEYYRRARESYDRALALNPELAEALIFKANLLTDTGHVEEAVPLLREVIRRTPQHAEAHWELGYAYRYAGMLNESVAEGERSRQLDPLIKITSSAFNSYLYSGQYEKFLASLPTSETSPFITFYRGFAYYHLKQMTQAAAAFDKAWEQSPMQLQPRIGRALRLGLAGESPKGLALLQETEKMIEERGVNDAEGIYKIAQAWAVLGDRAAALRVLRRSIEGGFFCYPYFVGDPLLQNLRGEPEYTRLMELARERHEAFRHRFF
ncbi:MAG: winged helix-turn-helix domain-containing protein [Blastocatellia bacterium]